MAAEIQRRLLPTSYTCEDAQFTLAGWLEPASTVGDTFDYNLDHETLQLSITDAVGHEVEAALLATLLVGSLRNGRRCGLKFNDQAATARPRSRAAREPCSPAEVQKIVRRRWMERRRPTNHLSGSARSFR